MNLFLVVVTGASRGFGKSCALAIAEKIKYPVHFILSGRNLEELNRTKQEILTIRGSANQTVCDIRTADLSNPSILASISDELFKVSAVVADQNKYSSIIFINNAGSLGPLNYIGFGSEISLEMSQAYNINVTSSCYLSSELIRRFFNHFIILSFIFYHAFYLIFKSSQWIFPTLQEFIYSKCLLPVCGAAV
jgi:short-subunit dehydrogenase